MTKRLQKKLLLILALVCFSNTLSIFSQSTFSNLILDENNRLLFTEEKNTFSGKNHKNLYFADIKVANHPDSTENPPKIELNQAAKETPTLTTCYPEQIDVLLNGKIIKIYNQEGVAKYSLENNTLIWEKETRFQKTTYISPSTEISPDGKWIVYYEKTTPSMAKIILENAETEEKIVLSNNAEYSFVSIPVKWAPDSTFLVYEKNSCLYFIDLREAEKSKELSENFRKIGEGTINNLHWANKDLLVYINHDMIYKIATNEIYTRSLYADMVGNGKISGRLTTALDSEKDYFVTNSDGSKIILVQNNKTIQYIELSNNTFDFSTVLFSNPFVNVPKNAISYEFFWTQEIKGQEVPFVWIEVLQSGKKQSYLYKLESTEDLTYFKKISIPEDVYNPQISPKEKNIAFIDDNALHIYDINSWKQIAFFSKEKIISYQWIDNETICLGGEDTISFWNPLTDEQNIFILSQAKKYGFDASTQNIVAENFYGNFEYNEENNVWIKTDKLISKTTPNQNPYWRVFLGESKNRFFTNGIYVRTLTGLSETRPLYVDYNLTVPNQPKIALVFDALDNADGITYILEVLSKFNIKATFFINGEFIRRYPNYVTEIVNSGHECASMFFTTADLTDSSYVVDEEFIRRGLARTEDEFYAVTGEELSLYWHTPYYKTTEAIIKGGRDAGYTLVRPTTKQLDLQTLEDTAKNSTTYYSSAKIIEGIFSVLKDKAIIPISVGLSNGTRTDYLYNKIDVLISAILEAGYEIVKVSDL